MSFIANKILKNKKEIKVNYSTLPSQQFWNLIKFGGDKFVCLPIGVPAGSTAKPVAVSSDGINWTEYVLPIWSGWTSLTYGAGKFLAISSSKVIYSTYGMNWSQYSVPFSLGTYCAGGDAGFVSCGGNNNLAAYSADGITWTRTYFPFTLNYSGVIYVDNNPFYKFAAFGYGNLGLANQAVKGYIVTSSDGVNWNMSGGSDILFYGENSMACLNGKCVAISSQQIAYSSDITAIFSVNTLTEYPNARFTAVAAGINNFMVIGYSNFSSQYSDPILLSSTNGIVWNRVNIAKTGTSTHFPKICYGKNKFVTPLSNSNVVAYTD
jgi:hypothetical protein